MPETLRAKNMISNIVWPHDQQEGHQALGWRLPEPLEPAKPQIRAAASLLPCWQKKSGWDFNRFALEGASAYLRWASGLGMRLHFQSDSRNEIVRLIVNLNILAVLLHLDLSIVYHFVAIAEVQSDVISYV